jgi:hypothetical protein
MSNKYTIVRSLSGQHTRDGREVVRIRPENQFQVLESESNGNVSIYGLINDGLSVPQLAALEGCHPFTIFRKLVVAAGAAYDPATVEKYKERGEAVVVKALRAQWRFRVMEDGSLRMKSRFGPERTFYHDGT